MHEVPRVRRDDLYRVRGEAGETPLGARSQLRHGREPLVFEDPGRDHGEWDVAEVARSVELSHRGVDVDPIRTVDPRPRVEALVDGHLGLARHVEQHHPGHVVRKHALERPDDHASIRMCHQYQGERDLKDLERSVQLLRHERRRHVLAGRPIVARVRTRAGARAVVGADPRPFDPVEEVTNSLVPPAPSPASRITVGSPAPTHLYASSYLRYRRDHSPRSSSGSGTGSGADLAAPAGHSPSEARNASGSTRGI